MMQEQLQQKPENKPTKDAIGDWLAERNQLLVLYCKLSGNRKDQRLPSTEEVEQFCEILIDYVSAGHFEIYEQIVGACEQNGSESLALLESLYPKISKTTDIVVDFNDKYSSQSDDESLARLDIDLSELGEAIANRVDMEDRLIDTLRTKH